MLSAQKIQDIREAFEYFDQEGKGYISTEELAKVMTAFGYNPAELDFEAMIRAVDSKKDGVIDFEEFLAWMSSQIDEEDYPHSELLEVFQAFDRDQDGLISPMELRRVFSRLGEKIPEDEFEQMIAEADLDGDGYLNYAEFSRIAWSK